MSAPWTERSLLHLRGSRYAVRRAGSGRPLLLLHGFAGSGTLWEPPVPPLLARGWQVVAPDLLGH
ncbi:MAG: alpha/beta hydrolase, partial [Thermomicrobium sp.]|nr:alpha/beta hydrolase [Thermomicrobium sp.]